MLKLTQGTKTVKVKVDASIGIAQWRSGEKRTELIARAYSSMYGEKKKDGTGA